MVTAKLSLRLYEKLGEEVATELVNWFNAVDATYRSDLRETNELNFARFDAKVEQRFAQADAKLEQRLAQVDQRITELGAALRIEIAQGLGGLKTSLLKWMFGFWATTILAFVTLTLRR